MNVVHVSFDGNEVVVSDTIRLNNVVVTAVPPNSEDEDVWRRRLTNVARAGRVRMERPGPTKVSRTWEWAILELAYFLAVEDPDSCWLVELEHLTGVLQTSTPYAADRIMRVRYRAQDVLGFAAADNGVNALKPMAEEGWRLRGLVAYLRAERRDGEVVTLITGRKGGRQAVDKIRGA